MINLRFLSFLGYFQIENYIKNRLNSHRKMLRSVYQAVVWHSTLLHWKPPPAWWSLPVYFYLSSLFQLSILGVWTTYGYVSLNSVHSFINSPFIKFWSLNSLEYIIHDLKSYFIKRTWICIFLHTGWNEYRMSGTTAISFNYVEESKSWWSNRKKGPFIFKDQRLTYQLLTSSLQLSLL